MRIRVISCGRCLKTAKYWSRRPSQKSGNWPTIPNAFLFRRQRTKDHPILIFSASPCLRGECWLYFTREAAVSNARRVYTSARCRRYSPEANRSELASTPSVACAVAALRDFPSRAEPFSAFSTPVARYAVGDVPVIPTPADWHLPDPSRERLTATPTTAKPDAG